MSIQNQQTQNLISNLNWRYATKAFNPSKKVSPEEIEGLMETTILAPSSFGLQPFKIVLVSNSELKEKLKGASYGQSQVADCSHLVIFCVKTKIDENDVKEFIVSTAKIRGIEIESLKGYHDTILSFIKNKDQASLTTWAQKQIYIALGFLLESAAQMKIDTCPMEGFNPSQFDQILGLKDHGLTSTVICTVGYRSEDDITSEYKKSRFSMEDMVINKE